MQGTSERHVIGATVIDLVKYLKKLERASGRPLPLGVAARTIFDRRVQLSEWLPLPVVLDWFAALDALVIQGDEERALAIGVSGGASMRGLKKTYVIAGDAKSSVAAMRHSWRASYDFGRIAYDLTNPAAVRFTVTEYLDMPMVHGMMIVGLGVAAGRAAGSVAAHASILERPWRSARSLTYDIFV